MLKLGGLRQSLEKQAGGGSRTLKSFRRVIQRIADAAKLSPEETRKMVQHGGLFHETRSGLTGARPSKVMYFSQGAPYGARARSGEVFELPVRKIREMRGKFGVDPESLSGGGVGQGGHAVMFEGSDPKAFMRGYTGPRTPMPEKYLLAQANPGGRVISGRKHFLFTPHDTGMSRRHFERALPAYERTATPEDIADARNDLRSLHRSLDRMDSTWHESRAKR